MARLYKADPRPETLESLKRYIDHYLLVRED